MSDGIPRARLRRLAAGARPKGDEVERMADEILVLRASLKTVRADVHAHLARTCAYAHKNASEVAAMGASDEARCREHAALYIEEALWLDAHEDGHVLTMRWLKRLNRRIAEADALLAKHASEGKKQ